MLIDATHFRTTRLDHDVSSKASSHHSPSSQSAAVLAVVGLGALRVPQPDLVARARAAALDLVVAHEVRERLRELLGLARPRWSREADHFVLGAVKTRHFTLV